MTRIAVLGLGAMGSRMATRLIDAGHQLSVWNRTHGRAAPLVAAGARAAATPAEAAAAAELILAMVRDDDASRAVWLDRETGALGAIDGGAVAVECSTLSVPFVRRLAARFAAAERAFLDVPLAGSRPQAEAGQLIFFAGGPAEALAFARPALEAMGAVHHAGDPGAGATVKLMANALFGGQLALIGELIGLARKSGIDAGRAIEILGATPIASPAAKGAADAMLNGRWAPAFPIDLVVKDFHVVGVSAAAAGAEVPVSTAAGAAFAAAAADGHADLNITGIVRRYG